MQLTDDEAGTDVDALLTRIERLENTVRQLRDEQPEGVSAATAHAPKDPATGRAVLGGAAAKPRPATTVAAPPPEQATALTPTPTPAAAVPAVSLSVPEAWEQSVKGQVKPLVRALYSVGSFVGNTGDTWQFSVPNEAHGAKCGEHRSAVESALSQAVGSSVKLEFVVGGRGHDDDQPATRPAGNTRSAPEPPPPADDDVDLSDLTDAPPESVRTPLDRLAEAFPGSEFVTES